MPFIHFAHILLIATTVLFSKATADLNIPNKSYFCKNSETMLTVKKFVFNPFGQNTYLIYDESNEAVVIDPGCYFDEEKAALKDFIEYNELKLVKIVFTHCHLDHAFGSQFIHKAFPDAAVCAHKNEEFFITNYEAQAARFGITMEKPAEIDEYLDESQKLCFGNSELAIIFAPGHSPGSLCFYNAESKTVIVGDVLFQGSIGRTDLYGGNHELLINNIKSKLLTLPEETVVYSGHGNETTIGNEKNSNPFF